jgi:DNA-binding protein Fis
MSVDVTYFRIERMIRSGAECFLCALEDEIERKYIDTYLSELVMDAKAREKIVESRGFCNHHFYKMLIAASKPESSDGHGIALVNKNIVEKLVQYLHKHKGHPINDLHKLLVTENECPACTYLSEFAKMYAEKIIELLSSGNDEFLKLLKESKGLCIPHLVKLVQAAKDVDFTQSWKVIKNLLEIEERNLRRLNLELAEYVKRQSYEFSEKDRLAVADVVTRSVKKIAGRLGMKTLLSDKVLE